MKTVAGFAAAVMLLAACATPTASPTAQSSDTVFTGTVWTWDERESTVTLNQSGKIFRVKTTPDQMTGLQLHQTARIRGTLAPPAAIETVTTPAVPMTAVPRGTPEQNELTATVSSISGDGRMALTSDRGPLHIWVASGAEQRFKQGGPARVTVVVQPVDMVPASSRPAGAADPAASTSSQPGDHATITGRIIGANPGGTLVVESPTGPVQVWVKDAGRYKVGDHVQVRTNVVAAQ